MQLRIALIIVMFVASLLAGCIGGDDVDPSSEDDDENSPEEGLGSLTGTIVTISLDPVENARVNLVTDGELVAETQSDEEGHYTINNIEPGEYRLQVTAPCCREHAQGVSIEEDDSTDVSIQLELFSSDDLQQPYVEQFDWTGFLACNVRAAAGANVCALAGDPSGDDDFLHVWEIREGVESVVTGMVWDSPGASLGDELVLIFEVDGRPNSDPTYDRGDGLSPLEIRADAGDVIADYPEEDDDGHNIHQYDFENVEDSLDVMYRVFAGGTVNIVYQQQFTVYWDVYYWEAAPEDASAVPDS